MCPLFQWLCYPYLTLGVPIRVKGGAEEEIEEEKSELLIRLLVLREAAACRAGQRSFLLMGTGSSPGALQR